MLPPFGMKSMIYYTDYTRIISFVNPIQEKFFVI